MPPRSSRHSTARAPAPADDDDAAYNVPNLNYSQALSWRAGKAISVSELLRRLEALSDELKKVEQGSVTVEDISKLAQDLVNPNLLGHKDKGIRAWSLQCVVDVLNICAPSAPYNESQLKDIFTVLVGTILPALADPTNAYNPQHQYILEQLVETQSIVLIADLPEPEQLLAQLFTVCFDVVSGSTKNASGLDLAQSVVFQIGMLLNHVIEEANPPQEVVDVIISQFLRVDPRSMPPVSDKKKSASARDKSQSTLVMKEYPPAYNVAKGICTTCSDQMAAAISQYFSAIITNASAALDGTADASRLLQHPDSDDDEADEDQESLDDLKKAHRLVKELWRACPDVLLNVIPQIEAELSADSVELRQLAVETLGDLVAGIGLAGLPELPVLDPAAFPLPTMQHDQPLTFSENPLLQPSSPKPFVHVHATTYQAFLGRRIDKAVGVRKAWVVAAARILLTNAGGLGLNKDELALLVSSYTRLLKDVDEKVRLAALEELAVFPYSSVIDILASDGGLSEPTSLLSTIAERVLDKKFPVRENAILLLGSMWGVASQDLSEDDEQVVRALSAAPNHLLSAMYTKDPHMMIMVSKALYECLLPLNWPPSKAKPGPHAGGKADPDTLRAQRMLTLVRELDEKSRPVFFGMQKRQADLSRAMTLFLKACEDFNGGINDDADELKRTDDQLKRIIDSLARQFPDHAKAARDLRAFAIAHDRRNYQLIRFAIGPEHDYKTMLKATRELTKRLQDGGSATSTVLDTLTPIMYQCSLISYNRSHIPAIMALARSSDTGLADAAQEVLREISEKVPEVMKTHIQVLCQELQDAAPSASQTEEPSAADSLKACSAFATKFPEDVPTNKIFTTALQNFALFSTSPKAAKHAAKIILLTSDKKSLRAKEILSKAMKRYKSDCPNPLAQLAAIAQVCLHSPETASTDDQAILSIAVTDVLKQNHAKARASHDESAWTDELDEETTAKLLALKILVNRCRAGGDDEEAYRELAKTVLEVLMTIVTSQGELVPGSGTPSIQRNHLRLGAARAVIKLCRHRRAFEDLVTPNMLQEIAWILIHRPYGVRKGLCTTLRKYLSINKLNTRWITPLFLLAFEPDVPLRAGTLSFLRSKATAYARQQSQNRGDSGRKAQVQNVMETAFARLLSLLAHHPDHPDSNEADYNGDLLDFAKNIVFYLQACATEENLSLIFHIAQRTKQAADAILDTPEVNERLYVLSDLAQATIRNYADILPASARGVNVLQTWPGKAQLPSSLFKAINGHEKARQIAAKNYLPEEVAGELELVVKKMVKPSKATQGKARKMSTTSTKRKISIGNEDNEDSDAASKSTKKSRKGSGPALAIRETPRSRKRKSEAPLTAEQPSRKSARTSTVSKINYEESEDEDDEEADEEEDVSSRLPQSTSRRVKARSDAENLAPAASSPTRRQKTRHAAEIAMVEDDDDVGMTNGNGETSTEEDPGAEMVEDEGEERIEEEDDVAVTAITPKSTRSSRRGKAAPVTDLSANPKTKSATKQKTTAKTSPKSATKSRTKGTSGSVTPMPASSPIPAEPDRRRSRRGKA